ncbi:universal stress protein Sll1388-like [Ostrea edulis]|uniref:universal stress protein Sll1388-like n=1 Tax=Ostrea edulis TaxID=37623 RepID=UPI0020956A60|nr:universal stress protein Sll1388-like [Ostrea edulis]
MAAPSSSRTIVIGVDDSCFSEYAFNFYLNHVRRAGDNIVLVHVPEFHGVIQAPAVLTDPGVVHELLKEEEIRTRQLVHKYSEKMKQFGLGGKMKQMTGKVGESIIEASKTEKADFIIVGTRGMSKVRRTFLGSVSDYCVHHAHMPVLVCRHKEFDAQHDHVHRGSSS